MPQMRKGYIMPRLPKSLFSGPAEPRPEKKERKRTGVIKYPDEMIIKMRTMYQKEGKTMKDVIAAYPDINENYIRNILNYMVRGNLIVW